MSGRGIGSRGSAGRAIRSRIRPRLEALEPRQLLATFTVTNAQDRFPDGSTVPGSFRDMIQRANLASGPDTIAFNIAGTGVHTISPGTALPPITDAVTIDGTTQTGFGGSPLIELNGTGAGVGTNGLRVVTSNVTIRALAINRFSGSGIRVESNFSTLQQNFIGTNPLGNAASPNGGAGIFIAGGSNNLIGGFNAAQGTSLGNVLSGNSGAGLNINGAGATGNIVQGNFLGTDTSGARGAGNSGDGVIVAGGSFNQIGGVTPGTGNVISGNANNGIAIVGASQGTSIFGNFIGVDGLPAGGQGGIPTGGNIALPNGAAGIAISGGATGTRVGGIDGSQRNIISGNTGPGVDVNDGPSTQILGNIIGSDAAGVANVGNLGAGIAINGGDGTQVGGTLQGAANVIAWNGRTFDDGGVNIQSGRRIPILSNAIANNFGLGVILRSPGGQPNQNDLGDPDQGPNDLQNYPVLDRAATAAGRTLIQGSLDTMANNTYTIQVFVSPTRDPSGFGEGLSLLGQFQVSTNADGFAPINVTLPIPSVIGQFVTATATDSQGNTSEFGLNTQVVQADQANLIVELTATPNPATLGSDLVYNITITNAGPDPATGVQFSQQLPTGVTFKGSSDPNVTPVGGGVVADLGTIAPGGQISFTVTVTPGVIGQATTTVTVTSGEIDPDTSDNTASLTVSVNIPADLGVDIVSNPASVTVGQNVALIARVANFGPGAATGSILRFVIPPDVSFVSASSGQGTTSFANGVVTANLGALANGVTIAVRVVVTAPVEVPAAGSLPFTATVSANEIDPDPSQNSASISVPVLPSSDVALEFTSSPEPVLAGANLTFTYRVVNNGLSPATNVNLVNVIPAGFEFIAAPDPSIGTADFTGSTVTAFIGDLAPGQSSVGTIVVRPLAPGIVPSTASVTLDQPDPDITNNVVTVISTISPVDLAVRIEASPSPVEAGSNLTYTLFVKNNGPADATNVQLFNTLPSGVAFVSAATGQGTVLQDGDLVTGSLGTITVGAEVAVTVVVTPSASSQLINTVAVSSDQIEVNGDDNSATSITFASPANLGVQLNASQATVLAGDTVTFTASVTNAGTSLATNVTLTNLLPTGLQLVSASASQGFVGTGPNIVSAQLGTLLPGASATVTIIASALTDGFYTSSASVTADQVDPIASDNSAVANVTVTNAPGVLQFATSTFSVPENAGLAVVAISRTGGNRGLVSVNFTTADGTGIAGKNYTTTTGTVTFLDGETTKTVSIPVIDDGIVQGDTTVRLILTNATGGATLGADAGATLIVTETNFDVTGPVVANVVVQGSGRAVTGVSLVFDEALDPTRAINPANYTVIVPGKNGRGLQVVPILTPTYDALTRTVTITTARSLGLNVFYRVLVDGSSATGVTDIFGNPLRGDGVSNGQGYTATFARGSSLRYTDGDGDAVSLNLSNGGLLDLYRSASGEGQILTVLGAGARRSVLSGSVRKGPFQSNGVTTFQSIVGANFGRVNSRLTTPRFFVDDVTAFINGSSASVRAARLAVALPEATPSAKLFVRKFGKRFGR